ncbi:MAG TPA: hypothetical protein VFM11_10500 [Burkholderiales bacterium]|nr:hypothetical protein [Burkholderiales bacterium]
MNKFTEQVAKAIGHHFVTLSCVQHSSGAEQMRIHVFSGFVVEIAGEWFYMTAGHILRGIRSALDAGSTFDVWRLGDQTAGNRFNNAAVPYAFDLSHWFVLEDADAGLDYATVHLDGLYRRQLEIGGVISLAKDAWSDHHAQANQWALVGIPSESVIYDGNTTITARVVMVPLAHTEPPLLAKRKAENQFYARVADGSEAFVNDLDGMSGGPIVMLHNVTGTWKYNVIGVQSAWYPHSRIVAACPFTSFAKALEQVVERVLRCVK